MQIYSDYRSLNGTWYTFKPLNVIHREELAVRFNQFDRNISLRGQLADDETGEKYWNLKQIFKLYNLDIDDFEIEELDTLLLEHILKVNYGDIEPESKTEEELKEARNLSGMDILADLISGTWGIADSAGDAMYLVEKLPADLLVKTVKKRSEALEKIYSTEEDKRKKQTKDIKKQLMENLHKQNENQKG